MGYLYRPKLKKGGRCPIYWVQYCVNRTARAALAVFLTANQPCFLPTRPQRSSGAHRKEEMR